MAAGSQQSARAAPLRFTDAAAAKVGELIAEEDNSDLMLRVYISGGGCSGFQYGFTFDERREEGDTAIENAGVVLLVDPMSVQYLMGAEIGLECRRRTSDSLISAFKAHLFVRTVAVGFVLRSAATAQKDFFNTIQCATCAADDFQRPQYLQRAIR